MKLKEKIKKIRIKKNDINCTESFPLTRIQKKNTLNTAKAMSDNIVKILENAFYLTNKLKHNKTTIMHFFLASLQNREVIGFFTRLNVDANKLINEIRDNLLNIPVESNNNYNGNCKWDVNLNKVFLEAFVDAYQEKQKQVRVLNLILPLIKYDPNLEEILYDLAIDKDKIVNTIEWFRVNKKQFEDYKVYSRMARLKPKNSMNKAYTSVATPTLSHFSYDLTNKAKYGQLEICVAREKEIQIVFDILESGQAGVVLIGHNGVGKRNIIEGIARLMVKEEVPIFLRDKRLIELDVARLISGANPAEAQERLLNIVREVNKARNIILYVDNIENLAGISSGGEESLELAEVLADAIERRMIFCLTTIQIQNYAKYIENKPLGNVLGRVDIAEPEGNQAIQILESKVGRLEARYNIYFSYNAIEQSVKLASKYIASKYLPEKAIKILESASVKIYKRAQIDKAKSMCTKEDIASEVARVTGIPISKIAQDESARLLNLEKLIHERMVDQEEAVGMVASSLRRARTELRDNKRPIASFLFLGPTGVGKTELAKTVADIYFTSEKDMIRLDMSEYQHPDSIKKMIGDASGALGYLTEAVRKKPFSLVLLDEFEKAHGEIFNLFLQVLDDGRLTDGQGRTISFTNCIIIATSNAGSLYIQEQLSPLINQTKNIDMAEKINDMKQTLINDHLVKVMRPELVNRFDGLIVFKPLSRDDVRAITKLMLKSFAKALEAKGINFRAEEEGISELARQGYDPKFGARPLRRLLQDKLENTVADKILRDELDRRDVVVINSQGEVEVEKKKKVGSSYL